ncbi:hypothetical protein Tco_0732948, partial [Tanacetum coccineum]
MSTLAEVKRTGMKAKDWTLLDRQALGVVRLSLAKNVAYNVVNEKTTYGLFKALSNMYEKPNHVNEFNSILSRLISDDIKFDDEVQALLLLSSLPDSWSGAVTTASGSTGTTKPKFDNIRDLILREDIRRKTSEEYSNYLLSEKDKGKGKKQDRWQKHNKVRSKSKKRGTVYHDLYFGGKALAERENVGLRVADSHTGNHSEDDFTPLETIRRSYSVIREKITFELEGETFEPERG